MTKQDWIIEVFSKDHGWCLECLVNSQNAEKIKAKLESEHPEKQYKVTVLSEEETKHAWWNNGCD